MVSSFEWVVEKEKETFQNRNSQNNPKAEFHFRVFFHDDKLNTRILRSKKAPPPPQSRGRDQLSFSKLTKRSAASAAGNTESAELTIKAVFFFVPLTFNQCSKVVFS